MPSLRRRIGDLRAFLRLRATRLLLTGGVLVLVELGVSAAFTLSHALSPTAFVALAGDRVGRPFVVDAVRLELRRTLRLHLEGVEIEGLGTAAAAEVDLRIGPLLAGRIRPRVVRVEEPHLVLERGENGEFLPLFPTTGGDDLSDLPALEANGGQIDVLQGEKRTAVIRLRSLSLGRFDRADTAKLAMAGNVTGGDGRWHVHPLQLRAEVVHAPGHVALVAGQASADHVGARWWSGGQGRARFAYRRGRIEIQSLDVRGFGGSWHASGSVRLRGGSRLDLALRVEGVDFASLLSAANGRGLETDADFGTLRMHWAPLRMPWRGGPRFAEGSGRGSVRIEGGMLPGTSLLAALAGLEPAPTPVESLSAIARLEGGRLHSNALRLVTGDYTLAAEGSVGLDRSVALEGRLDLAGELLGPTVPVTVAGTLLHPTVDAHVSGVGAVAGAVHKTGSAVLDGTKRAGRKIGALLGAAGRRVGDAREGEAEPAGPSPGPSRN